MTQRLFIPPALPPISLKGFYDHVSAGDPRDHLPRRALFGIRDLPRPGEFLANFYDAKIRFTSTTLSKRWRLRYERDLLDRIILREGGVPRASREYGFWQDAASSGVNVSKAEARGIGEGVPEDWFRVPFGSQSGNYRDLNAQLAQMNNVTQTVPIWKPTTLITDTTTGLGPTYLSTIQNKVEGARADGFLQGPPQSHYMDPDPASPNFGKWIEPENASVLTRQNSPPYWNSSSLLRVRLKHGVSHLHLWCASGEYREFDTLDKTHFKITRFPSFESEEVSLVIKTGWNEGTQWDVFLVPQRVQITSEWWDYYDAVTFFTHFVLGLHNVRNTLDRLPAWPVPYGMLAGEWDNILPVSDWAYYVGQWQGPFSPGPATAHPRPVGFQDAGGEEAFDPSKLTGGVWQPPVHGSDYALEYTIVHRTLLSHNVHDFEAFSPFFAIIYSHSSPVSYFARLALQQPGDLCAVIKPYGTHWRGPRDKFYVWQRALKPNGFIPKTVNIGSMFYNFDDPTGHQWSLQAALALGGWR